MNIKRKAITRLFLLLAIPGFWGCSTRREVAQKPNIVFILADDLGVEVPGCYGGLSYHTPNIDALAETGMQFDHCYSAPLCSPSRVKLLTGRYGFRTGQEWGHIPADEITFGHVLKSAGYQVAISGKWQMALLKDDPDHIRKMGFDRSCVFGWHEGPRYYKPLIYENGRIRKDVQDLYGPDVFADFLIDFIRENRDKPFFAYYSMTLAHEISNDLPDPPPFGEKGRYETYRENVEYADMLVGRIVKTLDELQLREKTLIIFTGDNGTPYSYITRYEDGAYIREPVYSAIGDTLILGGKSFMTDAGTHVPLILNWPGVIRAGSACNDLIDFSDFMPTFSELAEAEIPADRTIDGHSFAPQILGLDGHPRQWVYQEWEGKAWIRNREWKLYENGELFHMTTDPYETQAILAASDDPASKEIRSWFENEREKLKNK